MHALSTDEATVNYVGIRPDLREQVPWTLRPVDVNVTTRRPSAKKPKAELREVDLRRRNLKAEVGFFFYDLPPANY